MKIKVVNQRLYLEPPETAEGTREYLKAEFSFSEEWDGMTKTAFFRGADGENHPKLLEDDTCTVPAEALTAPGRVGVNAWGVNRSRQNSWLQFEMEASRICMLVITGKRMGSNIG